MKVLILSDIHYPNCSIEEIINIIRKEKPDKIVLLGDLANSKGAYKTLFKFLNRFRGKIIIVCGDNEKKYKIKCRKYLLIGDTLMFHGDTSNIVSERPTRIIAKILSKISKRLLKELYAFRVKKKGYRVIVGHSHFLGKSKLFDVYFAGTLCKKHYFLERGYIVLKDGKIYIRKL